MLSLPLLAPKPSGAKAQTSVVMVNMEHTEADWESHRHLIEHLYIREGRRLVDTMAIMAAKHRFGATLKKWNIRKRSYRKNSGSSGSATPPTHDEDDGGYAAERAAIHDGDKASPPLGTVALVAPSMMRLEPYAGLELVLDSVGAWSFCKLEATGVTAVTADPMVKYLADPGRPRMQDSRTMYRTFELVFDLWRQGMGQLAGLAARRAFVMMESVLTEDHPDLMWHMLDTVYDMVDRGHMQLLSMFLRHTAQLATSRLPRGHPL
ncbi:hypothetical protein E4U42_001970, partial [Claviceps africana]